MKKPRTIPRLLQMPQAQIDTLARWLVEDGMVYRIAKNRLEKEFGVKTNIEALSQFYHRYCMDKIISRQAAQAASGAGAAASLLEIVVDVSQPNLVRLKIIPGAGVKVEGGLS